MRKLIIATILSLISTVSFASQYCKTRPSSAQVASCFNAIIEQAKIKHDKTVQYGVNSSKISPANKRLLKQDTEDFINKVNNQCRTHECIYNSLVQRERIVAQFIQQNSQPAAQTNKR